MINALLRTGGSVREVAKRFGSSAAAVDRHRHHDDREKSRQNIGQIEQIDAEIKKLIRAQNRAKKKRDNAGALAIARELRAWFVLKTKAEIAAIGTVDSKEDEQLSPTEALTLAKGIIEARLSDPDVRAWLVGQNERIGALAPTQEPEENDG